jgi:phosphatidylserine decarboxylase
MRLHTLYEARWIFAVIIVLAAATVPFFPRAAGVFWAVVAAYVFYFFRDPDRVPPPDPTLVVAAADGRVADIEEVVEPEVLKVPMKRVGIFLSVFDVHTNRAPIAGRVTHSRHHPGKFLDARHPDATRLNECHTWAFENPAATLVVRQITGAIARRIVAWSKVGDEVKKGERFGMIRFGSRTEVYLPATATITVKTGDRVQGGATIIAQLH